MNIATVEEREKSVRVIPDNWLDPQPVPSWFELDQPIELDLGCGKGRFLLERARRNPGVNLIGIERQLKRIRKMDAKVRREGLAHVRLLRMEGYYAMRHLLPADCLSACYILFPDPWPKPKHMHHRLLNPPFMDALFNVLRLGGVLHFATDHLPYFHRVVSMLEADERFEQVPPFMPDEAERTDFELIFRDQKPIGRYACRKR